MRTTKLLLFFILMTTLTVMGQKVTYTFDSGGNGYSSDGSTYTNLAVFGSTTTAMFEVKTLSALSATAGGDGNTTNVFHGISNPYNTQAVDLTAFSGSSDQQVVWKTYLKTAGTTSKGIGVILRGQATASGYATGVRKGYHFSCFGSGTSGTVNYRIGKLDSGTGYTSIIGTTAKAISGFTNGPLYLKAKAVGTKLYFEYSTDSITFTPFPGSPFTDTSYSSGLVQLAWGIGAGSGFDQYYDNVTITDLSVPKVTISGNDKYAYTGAENGPSDTLSTNLFTSKPSLVWSYKGIGSTSYGTSTTKPTAAGQYIATVTATAGLQSAKDTLAYEILPATLTKYYIFSAETKGAEPTNTYCNTASKFLVQTGLGSAFGNKTQGNMLQPNGNALTTLANFGTTDSISTDYQVVWKDYATATGQKRGVILRAKGTNRFLTVSNNTVNVGQGYLFYVYNSTATALQLDIRKLESDTTTYKTPVSLASTGNLAYNGINAPTWYRATVVSDSLFFDYSTDGSTWISVHKIKDNATSGAVWRSGTTHVSSVNSGGSSYYFDYFGYKTVSGITTSLEQPNKNAANYLTVQGKSIIVNANTFEVYSVQGAKICDSRNSRTGSTIMLNTGVYIVKSGSRVQKVIVH
jgi:hypothetical protein